jgi:hypothetical protein
VTEPLAPALQSSPPEPTLHPFSHAASQIVEAPKKQKVNQNHDGKKMGRQKQNLCNEDNAPGLHLSFPAKNLAKVQDG